MQAPNDRSSAIAVGSFDQLAHAAGGQQVPNGSNAFTPMEAPSEFAMPSMQPTFLSALTANSDFAAFAEVAKGKQIEPQHPETSTPDLSKASFPAVNVGTTISGG